MTFQPLVSVIVVGFQSRRHLQRCFEAVLAQDYRGDIEVVFVDNASTDGSTDFVRKRFPEVIIVETGANLGYAGGNNAGSLRARGDILVFLNPDTSPEPSWLNELVRPLTHDPSVGLTTSKIVLMDQPDVVNTFGNDLSLSGIATCRYAGEQANTVATDEEVAAVSGAAFAIRATLFHQLGGFDERFWMYLEDTDLSWRARLLGYRCVAASRSVVAHEYSLTVSPGKTRRIERNRYLMLSKNLSTLALLALTIPLLLGEFLTWGWAALQGPRFVWAKAGSIGWMLRHCDEVYGAHAATQRLRNQPDGVLLRAHQPIPPVADIAGGAVGRLASVIVAPIANASAALALALCPVSDPIVANGSLAAWEPEARLRLDMSDS